MDDIDQVEVARAETQPVVIEKVPLPEDQAERDPNITLGEKDEGEGIHPDFDYDSPDHPNNNLAAASGQTMAAGSMPLGVLKQFEHDAGKLVTTLEESFHVSAGPVVTRDSLKPVQEDSETILGRDGLPIHADSDYVGRDFPVKDEPIKAVPAPEFKPASDYAHDPLDG